MSEENTPDNIIPITPEPTLEAPVGFSPDDQGLPSASDVSETPAVEQTDLDPVQEAIKGVDLNTLTKDDVFTDIIHNSKLFAFRLMVGAALLEQLIVKGQAEAAAAGTTGDEKPEVE
jgi:hypothetical protein